MKNTSSMKLMAHLTLRAVLSAAIALALLYSFQKPAPENTLVQQYLARLTALQRQSRDPQLVRQLDFVIDAVGNWQSPSRLASNAAKQKSDSFQQDTLRNLLLTGTASGTQQVLGEVLSRSGLAPSGKQELIASVKGKILRREKVKVCYVCQANINRSAVGHILTAAHAVRFGWKHIEVISGGVFAAEWDNDDYADEEYRNKKIKIEGTPLRLNTRTLLHQLLPPILPQVNATSFISPFKSSRFIPDSDVDLYIVAQASVVTEMLKVDGDPDLKNKIIFFTDLLSDSDKLKMRAAVARANAQRPNTFKETDVQNPHFFPDLMNAGNAEEMGEFIGSVVRELLNVSQ